MKLDWKWVGIGAVIMIALNFLAGIIVGVVLGAQLRGVTDPASVTLTPGQLGLIAFLNFLAYVVGGYIVGVRSAGRTILEPAISAAIAVALALLLSGNFTIANVLVGGLVPFLAGLLGGWLGEKHQAARA